MVNVATLVKFGAIAVAMCVATTSAVDVAETPRLLQTTDESPPPPGNAPLTPETSTPAPSDTTTPLPSDTTAPAPTESPSPVPSTPEPTTVTPEPTTVTPEPTTVTPEPTTVTPEPTTVTPEPTTVTPAPTTETPAPPVTTVPAPPVTTAPPTDPPAPEPTTTAPAPEPTTTAPPPPAPTTTAPAPEPTTTAPPPPPEPTTTAPPPPPEPTTTAPPPPPEPTTTAPPTPPEPTTTAPPTPPEPTTPAPPTPTTTAPPPEPTTTAPPTPTTPTPEPSTSAPPLVPITVPPEVTDEPPATTKPGQPTTVPPKTPEPDDDGQATAPDVILFNATKTTAPPNVDPFKITDVGTDAPKPVVLDIRDNEDTTEKPKLYVRGDVKTDAPTATNSDGSAVIDADGNPSTSNNDASTTNIIGGRHRNSATTADAILSSSSASFHDFLRYASVAFAGISVALLLFFHYVSLDATLSWTSALWSPNTWEFLLYVGYLQQMGAVSQLTLLKTPYFVWDYADSFAWTNFLVQRSVSTADAARRRLETVVLGGVVAYADRIGIDETKVVFHAVVGFVVVFAVLLMLFFIIAVLAKRKAEQALDASNLHVSTQSVHKLRSASIRTLGLCVLIWFFALYPLSLYASFEISMEIQSKTAVASALLVSILALGVACFGVLAWSGRVIMQKSKDELLQFENIATWGSLYAEFSYRSRMFFVLTALVQIVSGILVGTMDADPTQLIIVMLVQVLYLVAVFVMTPFAEVLVLRFTYGLGALKVLNYGLAFAFLNSNGLSGKARNRVADAFIGINTLVIIAWFVRQLIVFSTYIRAWSVRSSFMEEEGRVNHLEDSTAKYETRTATDSEVYASVTTARHGDSNGLSSDDDFHRAPPPTAMTTREVGF